MADYWETDTVNLKWGARQKFPWVCYEWNLTRVVDTLLEKNDDLAV